MFLIHGIMGKINGETLPAKETLFSELNNEEV